jgi:hypothetical protein
MRVTLRRTGDTYYRVSTDGAPLLVEIGPCRVERLEAAQLLLEVLNDAAAAPTYRRLFSIDRTLQTALAAEEEKLGNRAALAALIQPPAQLPHGPCVGAVLIDATRVFRDGEAEGKPAPCAVAEVGAGAACRALLDVVGLKRKPGEFGWHFDVVVSQLLLPRDAPAPRECPFVEHETPALESTMHDEESEYVVPDLEG